MFKVFLQKHSDYKFTIGETCDDRYVFSETHINGYKKLWIKDTRFSNV